MTPPIVHIVFSGNGSMSSLWEFMVSYQWVMLVSLVSYSDEKTLILLDFMKCDIGYIPYSTTSLSINQPSFQSYCKLGRVPRNRTAFGAVFPGWMPFLSSNQQCQRTEWKSKHWRQSPSGPHLSLIHLRNGWTDRDAVRTPHPSRRCPGQVRNKSCML